MTAINATVPELSAVRRPLSLPLPLPLPVSVSDFNLFTSSSTGHDPVKLGIDCPDPVSESDHSVSPSELKHTLLNYDVTESTTVRLLGRVSSDSSVGVSPRENPQSVAGSNNWLDLSVEVRKVGHHGEWEEPNLCPTLFDPQNNPSNAMTLLKNDAHHESNSLDVLLGNPSLHNSSGSDLLEADQGHEFPLTPKLLHSGSSTCSNSSSSGGGGSGSSSSSSSGVKKKRSKSGAALSPSPSRQPLQPPQPCSQMCTKVFTSTSALAKHRLTHSDERRFSCQLCGKAFKRQDHLNGHLITHREKKPFECSVEGCGKSYCDARSLRRHQDNHHAPGINSSTSNTDLHSPDVTASGHLFNDLSCGPADLLALSYPVSSSSNNNFAQPSPEYSMSNCPAAEVTNNSWAAVASAGQGDAMSNNSCIQYAPPSNDVLSGSYLPSATVLDNDQGFTMVSSSSATAWHDPSSATMVPCVPAGEPSPRKTKGKVERSRAASSAARNKTERPSCKPKKPKAKPKKADSNDGLTTQQLELIQEIMRQTQEQHRLMQEEQQQLQQKQQQQQQQQQQLSKSKKTSKVKWTSPGAEAANGAASNCPPECGRPVECNVCQRRFKNTPALNGHMRLHGGFLKKDSECKKPDKKDPNTPPLQTASVSIRALIEEKIIQRRNMAATNGHMSSNNSTPTEQVSPQPAVTNEDVLVPCESLENPVESQNGVKIEPESYFEGSLLALSPVSLHRALEGDSAVDQDINAIKNGESCTKSVVSNGIMDQQQQDHFFSTSSSSSSSALSDVPLLDDAVFHQVSAAAASALLSDIGSLDLQSYIDSGQQQGQQNLYSDCLSQYLAPPTTTSSMYSDQSFVQQTDTMNYVYNGTTLNGNYTSQHQSQQDLQRFTFDPSPLPSTPLSSLCSPQYMADQFQQPVYTDPAQYDSQQHSMLLPTPSPYTPSPSPVSPAVGMPSVAASASALPHLHRSFHANMAFPGSPNQQLGAANYFSSGYSNDMQQQQQQQSNNYMLDCSSAMLYSLENGTTPTWESPTSAASGYVEHQLSETLESQVTGKQSKTPPKQSTPSKSGGRILNCEMKKPRVSRAKKPRNVSDSGNGNDAVDSKRRRTVRKVKKDDLDDEFDMLGNSKFTSAMRSTISSSISHYTPPPMLEPKRTGSGLYWGLVKGSSSTTHPILNSIPQHMKGRVNVGKDYQCTALPRCKKDFTLYKEKESAVLLWSSSHDSDQVTHLITWAQSAQVPGPKLSTETVLSVLSQCRGDVQAAKLQLFQQNHGPSISDRSCQQQWSKEEMSTFHAALVEHGKDFVRVAQCLSSKTVSQCVQFYYVWKKLWQVEYKLLKEQWRSTRHQLQQQQQQHHQQQHVPNLVVQEDRNICEWRAGDPSMLIMKDLSTSPSSITSSLPCEFADCAAISTSRAGRRYCGNRPVSHSTNPRRSSIVSDSKAEENSISPPPCPSRPPSSMNSESPDKLYPCSVCNKVFDKVKSRSAHMKTHKVGVAETARSVSSSKSRKKSPAPSPCSSFSSASCSLPSPFLPSQTTY